MIALHSPHSGLVLRPERDVRIDGPFAVLTDGAERWPMLDGIPFLRVGREDLVASILKAGDAGDPEGALVLALADQDDWWDGPVASVVDRVRLVRERDTLTLREAMGLLALGRVGDYFAHRWSDPTYLAGLALLDAHWQAPGTAFELACGIGHYLRDLSRRGVDGFGADVVFAKLWLARHWVCPRSAHERPASPDQVRGRLFEAPRCCAPQDDEGGGPGLTWGRHHPQPRHAEERPEGASRSTRDGPDRTGTVELVCFDAAAPWPVRGRYDLVLCHDAFYFLEPKSEILARLRGLVREEGVLAIGHVHNREAENLSAGSGVTAGDVARWFPDAAIYDDADLTRAAAEGRAPRARSASELRHVEAFGVAEGCGGPAGRSGLLAAEGRVRLNPLYEAEGDAVAIRWPSERYRAEYALRATYRERLPGRPSPSADGVRRREFLDLPERW